MRLVINEQGTTHKVDALRKADVFFPKNLYIDVYMLILAFKRDCLLAPSAYIPKASLIPTFSDTCFFRCAFALVTPGTLTLQCKYLINVES